MSPRAWILLGCLLAAAGVAAGAYGAHGLEAAVTARVQAKGGIATTALPDGLTLELSDADRQEVVKRLGYWEVAARYQMYHALGMVLAGLVAARQASKCATLAGFSMLLGVALFCGLLDVMAFGGPKWLGAIVPLGGLAMIGGWLALGYAGWRAFADPNGKL